MEQNGTLKGHDWHITFILLRSLCRTLCRCRCDVMLVHLFSCSHLIRFRSIYISCKVKINAMKYKYTCAQSFYFWHIPRWLLCSMHTEVCAIHSFWTAAAANQDVDCDGNSNNNNNTLIAISKKKKRRRKEIFIVFSSFRALHITRLMSSFVLDGYFFFFFFFAVYLFIHLFTGYYYYYDCESTLLWSVEKCERYCLVYFENNWCWCYCYFMQHVILSLPHASHRAAEWGKHILFGWIVSLPELVHFQANF